MHDDWQEAVAREYPNTYLELTALLGHRGVVDVLCEGVGSERLPIVTGLPWFDEQHGVGALLSMSISDEDVRNTCHRNAEKLPGL